MPIWRIHFGVSAGLPPLRPVSSPGPKPHRHATGMPWTLPLGVSCVVLKSACASSQSTRSFLPGVAAMARDRADRADREAVVAAEQDRQARVTELGADRFVDQAVPVDDLREMAIAVGRRQPRIGRAGEVAAVDDLEAAVAQRLFQARDAQRFRAHRRAASLAPMSVGAPIRTAARFVFIRARP